MGQTNLDWLWRSFMESVARSGVYEYEHTITNATITGHAGTGCILTVVSRIKSGSQRVFQKIQCPIDIANIHSTQSGSGGVTILFKQPVSRHVFYDVFQYGAFVGRQEEFNEIVYDLLLLCETGGYSVQNDLEALVAAVQHPPTVAQQSPVSAPASALTKPSTNRFRVD